MPTINMIETGKNIKTIMKLNNIKIVQIQQILGFNTPQAIYKWFRGEAMPTLDNMVVLAATLNTTIDNLIVTETLMHLTVYQEIEGSSPSGIVYNGKYA